MRFLISTIRVFFIFTIISIGRIGHTESFFRIPVVDLDHRHDLQIVVDKEEGVYLGHPSTVLLEDGKTILIVYPKGHGKGEIVYKRSRDGGKTWSRRLPVPENWSTSKEVPTIHRVINSAGVKRLIMWSGLYPARLAVSEDEGLTWSPLKKVGNWGGIVVMGSVVALKQPGHYLAMFHDDGRDRHTGKYTHDGKLFISFRDMAKNSPTQGDWVAWIGNYEDLTKGGLGDYRIRIKNNFNSWDSTYPGVEILPNGTIVTTTYGHWDEEGKPYIISVRLDLKHIKPN